MNIQRTKEKLKQDVLKISPEFSSWTFLKRVLDLNAGSLDHTKLLKINDDRCQGSTIIALLSKLGVYEYEGLGEKNKKSEAQITENGLIAYELAYKPLLMAIGAQSSGYVTSQYRMNLDTDKVVE